MLESGDKFQRNLNGVMMPRTSVSIAGVAVAWCLAAAVSAHAATETVIYAFENPKKDGAYPQAQLTWSESKLYGTTAGGGTGFGTVFWVKLAGDEKVLHALNRDTHGVSPFAGLIKMGMMFYGTTYEGGAGAVFLPWRL